MPRCGHNSKYLDILPIFLFIAIQGAYLILKDPQYEFAGIYADKGISGQSMRNRTEFLKLIDECKAGNVDLILTKSISRFSRNSLDCLETIRMLKNLPTPVLVYFEKEGISTNDEKSDLMISIFGGIAQEESINSGEAIAWGRRRHAERGIVNLGVLPYGYRLGKNGDWEIVEDEAAVIREIYQQTINGISCLNLVKTLNSNNVKPPSGKGQWWLHSIYKILTSETYKGDYLYQKSYSLKPLKKLARNDGALPQFLVSRHHDPIISYEDSRKAQEIISQRSEFDAKRRKVKYSKDHGKNKSFEGVYYCGSCGTSIGYKRTISGSTENHNWICNKTLYTYRTDHCDSSQVNQKYLELNFYKMLQDIKEHKSLFRQKVLEHIETLQLSCEEEQDVRQIKDQMAALNQTLYEVVDQELNKKGQDSMKVDQLTEQIICLQSKLKEYKGREAKTGFLNNELSWFLKAINGIDAGAGVTDNQEEVDPGKPINFDNALFDRITKACRLTKDGRVVYDLSLGVQWSINYNYSDYKDGIKRFRQNVINEKKLAFLNGPVAKAVLEFCIEPKSSREILEFLNEQNAMNIVQLRSTVIRPLIIAQRLKYTIPEHPQIRNQKYYTNQT